jgi:hypothetical protein
MAKIRNPSQPPRAESGPVVVVQEIFSDEPSSQDGLRDGDIVVIREG